MKIIREDVMTREELMESVSKTMNKVVHLQSDLEYMGFMNPDRWIAFNELREELKSAYVEIKTDKLKSELE